MACDNLEATAAYHAAAQGGGLVQAQGNALNADLICDRTWSNGWDYNPMVMVQAWRDESTPSAVLCTMNGGAYDWRDFNCDAVYDHPQYLAERLCYCSR